MKVMIVEVGGPEEINFTRGERARLKKRACVISSRMSVYMYFIYILYTHMDMYTYIYIHTTYILMFVYVYYVRYPVLSILFSH